MDALIIVESEFGNTAHVANAIADGLRRGGVTARVMTAAEAPDGLDAADVVIVGAPTHNLGLPTPRSREIASTRGAHGVPVAGVAEWLEGMSKLAGRRFAAFDTAVPGRFSGSAAKRITRSLRSRGGAVVARASFGVSGSPPSLTAGEEERAERWGAALASGSAG